MSRLPLNPAYFLDVNAKSDPISSMAAASPATLEALILAKLNTAANLQKDIALLVQQLAAEFADVKLAEMLLEQKRSKTAKTPNAAGGE